MHISISNKKQSDKIGMYVPIKYRYFDIYSRALIGMKLQKTVRNIAKFNLLKDSSSSAEENLDHEPLQ